MMKGSSLKLCLFSVERAQARQVHQAAVQPSGSAHSVKPIQSALPSLLLCCLKHTTQRLNDPRHQILSLAGISEDMAQVIITHLLKEKQLKPKTLNPFIPWYVKYSAVPLGSIGMDCVIWGQFHKGIIGK